MNQRNLEDRAWARVIRQADAMRARGVTVFVCPVCGTQQTPEWVLWNGRDCPCEQSVMIEQGTTYDQGTQRCA
jgi:hypothetical protein